MNPPTGHKTSSAMKSDDEGKELQKRLCYSLLQEGKIRPTSNGMKYSCRGLVYFAEVWFILRISLD